MENIRRRHGSLRVFLDRLIFFTFAVPQGPSAQVNK